MAPGQCEDSECVGRILRGECRAFDEIVSRHQNRIFSLLLMMTGNRSGAEEVTQDAFLRAYANLPKYDQRRPFYPWLATIASRLGVNWINRTGARLRRDAAEFDPADLQAPDSSPVDALEMGQAASGLWEHVAQLPPGERTAVLMFYKQELSVGEIAGVLGVTTGTVKTFLHRGRAHLRSRIESTGGGR